MTVIEILKRSEYHYRPTLEEWDEIWEHVQLNEELMNNEFIRSLYQQWERKCQGKWADKFPLLTPKQVRCLITTAYPQKPPRIQNSE